jgi:single-strand DNA-binding protein
MAAAGLQRGNGSDPGGAGRGRRGAGRGAAPAAAARADATAAVGDGRNDVALRGRLAAAADERTLPSGDAMVSFRLVVPRGAQPARSDGVRRPSVDTIDCVAWPARVRRAALAWQPGDTIEVEGALRRRFWRGAGGGPASRCEVEVAAARVIRS